MSADRPLAINRREFMGAGSFYTAAFLLSRVPLSTDRREGIQTVYPSMNIDGLHRFASSTNPGLDDRSVRALPMRSWIYTHYPESPDLDSILEFNATVQGTAEEFYRLNPGTDIYTSSGTDKGRSTFVTIQVNPDHPYVYRPEAIPTSADALAQQIQAAYNNEKIQISPIIISPNQRHGEAVNVLAKLGVTSKTETPPPPDVYDARVDMHFEEIGREVLIWLANTKDSPFYNRGLTVITWLPNFSTNQWPYLVYDNFNPTGDQEKMSLLQHLRDAALPPFMIVPPTDISGRPIKDLIEEHKTKFFDSLAKPSLNFLNSITPDELSMLLSFHHSIPTLYGWRRQIQLEHDGVFPMSGSTTPDEVVFTAPREIDTGTVEKSGNRWGIYQKVQIGKIGKGIIRATQLNPNQTVETAVAYLSGGIEVPLHWEYVEDASGKLISTKMVGPESQATQPSSGAGCALAAGAMTASVIGAYELGTHPLTRRNLIRLGLKKIAGE